MRVSVKKHRNLSVCADLYQRLEFLERELGSAVDELEQCVSVEALVKLAAIHAERMSYELLLLQLEE